MDVHTYSLCVCVLTLEDKERIIRTAGGKLHAKMLEQSFSGALSYAHVVSLVIR